MPKMPAMAALPTAPTRNDGAIRRAKLLQEEKLNADRTGSLGTIGAGSALNPQAITPQRKVLLGA